MRDALKLRGHLDSVRRAVAEGQAVAPRRSRSDAASWLTLNAALCAAFGLLRLSARGDTPQFLVGATLVVLGCLIAAGLIARGDRDRFREVLLVALEMALVAVLCVAYFLACSLGWVPAFRR